MDQIEKVVYINLSHRADRRVLIEKELSVFPDYKVIRFEAIYEPIRGHLGCSKSHIAVLEMAIANKWKNYLVVEDDMMWNNFEKGSQLLPKIMKNNPDVIVLGGSKIVCDSLTLKLSECQCTTAYLVFDHYYQTLLSNFKEGAFLLNNNYIYHGLYAIDQYWKKLQESDNWYVIYPTMSLQRAGYSDINKEFQAIKNDSEIPPIKETPVITPNPLVLSGFSNTPSIFKSPPINSKVSISRPMEISGVKIPAKVHNWPPSRF
jgi:glycosyl transferase family 25